MSFCLAMTLLKAALIRPCPPYGPGEGDISGKRLQFAMDVFFPFSIGKSTISIAMFNCYVKLHEHTRGYRL